MVILQTGLLDIMADNVRISGIRNLNFVYWNIHGLNLGKSNSKANDPDVIKQITNYDIVCLAETHCKPGEHLYIEGYCTYGVTRPVSKHVNRSFGGITLLYKQKLKNGVDILASATKTSDYFWIKLCKRFFGLDSDVFVCFVYIPPENSNYYQSRGQDMMQMIEKDASIFSKKGHIKLVGDFNARTGTLTDCTVNDKEPNDLYVDGDMNGLCMLDSDIETRDSQDRTICKRGRELIDLCTASRSRILNGRISGDTAGWFTCHNTQGSSVVDYAIVSQDLLDKILYFEVGDFMGHLSDHCLISWGLICNYSKDQNEHTGKLLSFPKQFKWNAESSIADFQLALTTPSVQNY